MPPRVSGRDAEMEHSEGDSAKEQQRQHVGDRRYERIGKDGGVDVNGFCQDMNRDPLARDSVELCPISLGGEHACVECDFATPDRITLPELVAVVSF